MDIRWGKYVCYALMIESFVFLGKAVLELVFTPHAITEVENYIFSLLISFFLMMTVFVLICMQYIPKNAKL